MNTMLVQVCRQELNRSIRAWVAPETTFTLDLHITNLSQIELGALVWLLTRSWFIADVSIHLLHTHKTQGWLAV